MDHAPGTAIPYIPVQLRSAPGTTLAHAIVELENACAEYRREYNQAVGIKLEYNAAVLRSAAEGNTAIRAVVEGALPEPKDRAEAFAHMTPALRSLFDTFLMLRAARLTQVGDEQFVHSLAHASFVESQLLRLATLAADHGILDEELSVAFRPYINPHPAPKEEY